MINKDYLQQIVAGEKQLMFLKDTKPVNMPSYDELSVKQLWPLVNDNPDLMKYFPDNLPAGRIPSHEYFFTILNTLDERYV
jgi:hypothetical protein